MISVNGITVEYGCTTVSDQPHKWGALRGPIFPLCTEKNTLLVRLATADSVGSWNDYIAKIEKKFERFGRATCTLASTNMFAIIVSLSPGGGFRKGLSMLDGRQVHNICNFSLRLGFVTFRGGSSKGSK